MYWGVNQYNLVRLPIRKPCKGYYLRWYYNGWHYWFFAPGTISVNTEGEKYRTIGTRKITMGTGNITRGQAIAIRSIMMTREVYLLTDVGWMNIRIEPGSLIVYDNSIAGAEMEFTAIIGSKELSYTTGFSPVPGDGETPPIIVVPPDTGYCEVTIGTQTWMCKNWDVNYPGSKVYNNDEANRAIYGGLYTYAQIMSPGFCPDGWHVPTLDEWLTLINFIGTLADAGGKLKEVGTTHWTAPNTDAIDSVGFTALPAGAAYVDVFTSAIVFTLLESYSWLWTATPDPNNVGSAYLSYLAYDSAAIANFTANMLSNYMSVRLIKGVVAPQTVVDVDGNVYTYVTIGTQQWMVENLKTTKYADGTPIPNLTLDADWLAEDGTGGHDGAYCWYDNDIAYKTPYGALYNWYAVDNAHGLAPTGWRVPSDADWAALSTFLGGDAVSGGKLKEAGLAHWLTPNTGATNSVGFSALGSGLRSWSDGLFSVFKITTYIWCGNTSSRLILAYADIVSTLSGPISERWGCSVRCMRDI